jgi:hypothetical protein
VVQKIYFLIKNLENCDDEGAVGGQIGRQNLLAVVHFQKQPLPGIPKFGHKKIRDSILIWALH